MQALRAKGLQVSGVVCHVGNAQHRSSLIQQTIQVGNSLTAQLSNAQPNRHCDAQWRLHSMLRVLATCHLQELGTHKWVDGRQKPDYCMQWPSCHQPSLTPCCAWSGHDCLLCRSMGS